MSHKKIIFSLYKTTTTIMSNITVAVNMKISFMYVGMRRDGVGAFLVQLLGYKKSLQY